MNAEENRIDPYRILFPLGVVSALSGIVLWLLFLSQELNFYPRQAHGNIMFLACLWSFISGFLMTAIPKMTHSFSANKLEMTATIVLIFAQLTLNFSNQVNISVALFVLQILLLVFFVVRRILITKRIPFEGFFFLPFAFVQGILGVILFYSWKQNDFGIFYGLAAEALVLNLILGIGSRLIPLISRCPNALMPNTTSPLQRKASTLLLAVTLNAGILLEVLAHERFGSLLKLLVVLWISFKSLGIHIRPTSFTIVGLGIKLGLLILIVSLGMEVFGVGSLAALHLLYIGVFLLITLMVATRVMVSHGKQNMIYESRSLKILIVIALLLFAAVSRYLSGVDLNGILMRVSIYSSVLAIGIWGYEFVKILFKTK